MPVKTLLIILLIAVTGCTSVARRQAIAPNLVTHANGWQWNILNAGQFDLAVASSPVPGSHIMAVYLEGDGFAFVRPSQPSTDPTPTDPVALRLAMAQLGYESPVWLGRPCQYTMPDHGRNCEVKYWTSHRYAPEVLDSYDAAIDQMKARLGATRIVLVGYSGGGALAALLAARRSDVEGFITVVANLDLGYWTQRDGLSPLWGSLDPANVAANLGHMPQFHFTGGKDKAVGTDVVASFIRRLPEGTPVGQMEIKEFTHSCCWGDVWADGFRQVRDQMERDRQ